MKKILGLVLAFIFCGTAAGCGAGVAPPQFAQIPEYTEAVPDISTQETYQNNIVLDGAWENYGIGDPYIMKYNGVFYLYVSTPYNRSGIKVFSSTNAVDFTYRGLVGEDSASTFTAYSPKVVYSNGVFYLYTTPNGDGLRILTSRSPLGPFVDYNNGEKLHSSIDACIFIDDDGTWYLGHGHAYDGIEYHKMTSPTEIDPKVYYPGTVISGTNGNNWTETGEIFKRGDTYFMTYSGNHVANYTYRTNWASSDKVLDGYSLGQEPLLTSTDGKLQGTGCGLVFRGPDLMSDYVVYHNLINPNIGPIRGLNIDRVSYNGSSMTAFGPTPHLQQKPSMPTSFDYLGSADGFDGVTDVTDGFGKVAAGVTAVYKQKTNADYVAEMTFDPFGGTAEILFSQAEGSAGGKLAVSADGALTLTVAESGGEKTYNSKVDGYDARFSHEVRIDNREGVLQVYVDGMRKFDVTAALGGETLGIKFSSNGRVGYTAFTNADTADSVKKSFAPVGGRMFAVDCLEKSSGVSLTDTGEGGKALKLAKNEYVRYRVNAGESNRAAVQTRIKASGNGTLALTDVSGKILARTDFAATGDKFVEYSLGSAELSAYNGVVTFTVMSGEAELESFVLSPSKKVTPAKVGTIGEDGFTTLDGQWTAINGAVKSYDIGTKPQANAVFGSVLWDDYAVSAAIKLDTASSGRAGLLTRVKSIAANTGTVHQIFAYNDRSYYAYLDTNGFVGLTKHNYNAVDLVTKDAGLAPGKTYTLKVKVTGNKILVYVDNKLQIEYVDTLAPYLTGKVGLHSETCTATYTDFQITES